LPTVDSAVDAAEGTDLTSKQEAAKWFDIVS